MNEKIKVLSTKQIKFLKKKFEPIRFNADFHLVYEFQVPNTGIVLLTGELSFFRKKKVQSLIKSGAIFGVYELINNVPMVHGCRVLGNSELILLHKSDLLAAMTDKNSELFEIIKDHIV